MKNLNEKNYVWVGNVEVEVSAEVEKVYRNMQDCQRIKQHRRGECHCPRNKWYTCSTDCATCPYRNKNTTNVYLDSLYDEDGENYSGEYLYRNSADGYISFENIFINKEHAIRILKRVQELMPELIEYGELKMKGCTNAKIAEILGIKRSTMDSRIAKVYSIIRKEFPDTIF